MHEEVTLLAGAEVEDALDAMARQIVDLHKESGEFPVGMVGIATGGVPVAKALVARIGTSSLPIESTALGSLDITLYRDDTDMLARRLDHPVVGPSHIPFDVTGRDIFLVDDVLYSGRTVRAAIDALLEFGRPRRILLAVLCDRGGRELPIQADIVGYRCMAPSAAQVDVVLAETSRVESRIIRRTLNSMRTDAINNVLSKGGTS